MLDARQTFVARGAFDARWQPQAKYTEIGDAVIRAGEPLRTAPTLVSAQSTAARLPLSALLESAADGAFRNMLRDVKQDGKPLRTGGHTARTGLSLPLSWGGTVDYNLADADWTRLRFVASLELVKGKLTGKQRDGVKVAVIVKGDGNELARVQLSAAGKPQALAVDISGVKTLRLEMANQGDDDAPVRSIDLAEAYLEQ